MYPSLDKGPTSTIIQYFAEHCAGSLLTSKLSTIGEIFSRIILTDSIHKVFLNTKKIVMADDSPPVVISHH